MRVGQRHRGGAPMRATRRAAATVAIRGALVNYGRGISWFILEHRVRILAGSWVFSSLQCTLGGIRATASDVAPVAGVRRATVAAWIPRRGSTDDLDSSPISSPHLRSWETLQLLALWLLTSTTRWTAPVQDCPADQLAQRRSAFAKPQRVCQSGSQNEA